MKSVLYLKRYIPPRASPMLWPIEFRADDQLDDVIARIREAVKSLGEM